MTPGMGMSTSYPPVTPGPAATGAHNDADVAFATGMIPHHGQAVMMADMVLSRTSNDQVKALAAAIKQAQTPEIAQMSGWLKGWGAPVPDPYQHMAGMAGTSGASGSGMHSGGMMSGGSMPGGMTSGGMGSGMPSSGMSGMPSGMMTSGMMSDEQMQQLSRSNGTAMDKAFLTMMVQHHEGAIAMAKTELAQGTNPQAKQLAQRIATSQQAEIDRMKQLLTTLG